MATLALKALPPEDALKFFRAKGFKPAFDYRDVWKEQHAFGFTVAKATRLDILADIRGELDKAIANGTTKAQFLKDMRPALQKKGWWGRREAIDPKTGLSKVVQLGSPHRLKTIYDTNVRQAYHAGDWAQIERNKEHRPFLFYSAVRDENTRPEHLGWHGTVLPVDHPWWDSHMPMNGWRCRCRPIQLSQRDLDRRDLSVTKAPKIIRQKWLNKRTGETELIPKGIDPGFDYNVGKAHARGLVPPPRSGPISTPAINLPADTPMPDVRQVPASRVLGPNLSDAAYVDAFLGEFGAARAAPVIFEDVLGESVVISEDLFQTARGASKIAKADRARHVLLLAEAIRDPDEIWWIWEPVKDTDRHILRRRYFARFNVAGGRDLPAMAAFDVGRDGWTGVTTFKPRTVDYLMRQRAGVLAYRRIPDK